MSLLKTQLDEALVLNKAMHAELERRVIQAEEQEGRGIPGYEDYDEWKADAYEAAVLLLDSILLLYAEEEPGIILRFGDGTDAYTFNDVFGHLANGYVIEVNGHDMVCNATGGDETVGLYGLAWQSPDYEVGDPESPVGTSWDDLESVTIY